MNETKTTISMIKQKPIKMGSWLKLIFLFIIKFRYNARADWLKQRALSEYRCTEQWCHAISPFVKFLDFSLGLLFFDPNVFYNLENENELLASMDIDHPMRIQGKKQYK